ncbi:MAG: hypothetical protein GXO32_02825 [Crenarchaeota archaeon]|nr:hypothetical protein [Thermoproteota archaeon]
MVAADGDEDTCPLQIRLEMKTLPRPDPFLNLDLCTIENTACLYRYPMPIALGRILSASQCSKRRDLELAGFIITSVAPLNVRDLRLLTLATLSKESTLRIVARTNIASVSLFALARPQYLGYVVPSVIALEARSRRSLISVAFTHPARVEILNEYIVSMRISSRCTILFSDKLRAASLLRLLQCVYSSLAHDHVNVEILDPYTLVLDCKPQRCGIALEIWNPYDIPVNAFLCLCRGEISSISIENSRFTVGKRCVRVALAPDELLRLVLHTVDVQV